MPIRKLIRRTLGFRQGGAVISEVEWPKIDPENDGIGFVPFNRLSGHLGSESNFWSGSGELESFSNVSSASHIAALPDWMTFATPKDHIGDGNWADDPLGLIRFIPFSRSTHPKP